MGIKEWDGLYRWAVGFGRPLFLSSPRDFAFLKEFGMSGN